jgi:hypothetical protein
MKKEERFRLWWYDQEQTILRIDYPGPCGRQKGMYTEEDCYVVAIEETTDPEEYKKSHNGLVVSFTEPMTLSEARAFIASDFSRVGIVRDCLGLVLIDPKDYVPMSVCEIRDFVITKPDPIIIRTNNK